MSTHDRTDERIDINPRFWLSKYQRTSSGYLLKMFFFYHSIGIMLLLVGSHIISQFIPNYEDPNISRYLISVLAAGPIEETLFFGIPFYLFGNPFLVLAAGSFWSATHLFNTNTIAFSNLAFGNWLFTIPSLFFSLRTWISGKGWFAIIAHSAWNGIFFTAGCAYGEFSCSVFRETDAFGSALSIAFSAGLLIITYMLYKWRKRSSRSEKN